MTQIGSQSPVLTPAKQSKKNVPDKALLGPKVRFGMEDQRVGGSSKLDSSAASEGMDSLGVDSLGTEKPTGEKQATESQNAGGNFIEKVFEFFKKLQATVEALLDRLSKYLEELGEKLTSPKAEKRDETSPPSNTSGSAERSSDGLSGGSHDKDSV